MHNRDSDYNIEHILKEKLECIGQLLDVMGVVEGAAQIFDANASTNHTNNETDDEQTHKSK